MKGTLISHDHTQGTSIIEGVFEGDTFVDIIKQGFFREGTDFNQPDIRDDLKDIVNSFNQLNDDTFTTNDNEELTYTLQIG